MKQFILSVLSLATLSTAVAGCALDAQSGAEPSKEEAASQSSALSGSGGGDLALASTNLGCGTQGSLDLITFASSNPEGYTLTIDNPAFSDQCTLHAFLNVPGSFKGYQVRVAGIFYQGTGFTEGGPAVAEVNASIGSQGVHVASVLSPHDAPISGSSFQNTSFSSCNFATYDLAINYTVPPLAAAEFSKIVVTLAVQPCH